MITFGPVPSRRLGKSLGLNNIIFPKTCSYNCNYCQVGKTIKNSCKREHFYKPEFIYESVLKHLNTLSENNYPDYLTFVSNGEPTLDINLGRSIELLKKIGIPVAVITNASLLGDESLRKDLRLSDLVSVKMDAGDNETWQKVNCPAPGLEFEKVTEGKNLFASEFKGILYTETMLVEGVNDFSENLINVAKLVHNLNPAKAYLSIPIRPPAGSSVKAPGPEKLNQAWQIFNDMNINTEFLTGFEGTNTGFTGNIYEDILNITAVHPLREDSMIKLLQNDNAGYEVVDSLIRQKLIRISVYGGKKFYLREYHINI
jgi:wyosine [tRNA(Phe)-imidazoG37] synthetase (radical SAM superfamily)